VKNNCDVLSQYRPNDSCVTKFNNGVFVFISRHDSVASKFTPATCDETRSYWTATSCWYSTRVLFILLMNASNNYVTYFRNDLQLKFDAENTQIVRRDCGENAILQSNPLHVDEHNKVD